MSRRDARLLQSDSHVIAAIRDDGARNGAATAREVAASQGLDGSRGRATSQFFPLLRLNLSPCSTMRRADDARPRRIQIHGKQIRLADNSRHKKSPAAAGLDRVSDFGR